MAKMSHSYWHGGFRDYELVVLKILPREFVTIDIGHGPRTFPRVYASWASVKTLVLHQCHTSLKNAARPPRTCCKTMAQERGGGIHPDFQSNASRVHPPGTSVHAKPPENARLERRSGAGLLKNGS